MLFFKRILNFEKETVAQREQRHARRYEVTPASPLRATLQLGGHAHTGALANLSSSGASLQVPSTTEATRGQAGGLAFTLDAHQLTIDCEVAHVQPSGSHTTLGLALKFADYEIQKAYLQLLEPVAIGASLIPANAGVLRQHEPGMITEQYDGPNDARLTIWRNFAGQSVHGFEFRMHDYFVRSHGTAPGLEIYTCEEQSAAHKQGYAVPALQKAGEQSDEIRQLFRWVVPHLSQAVPDDTRVFLGQFVA